MVARYQVGWTPQTRQDLPKPKINPFSLTNLGSAFSSGLNERWVAQGIDAYTEYKSNQSELTIPEEEWTSSNIYWRDGIDWTPNLTVDKAKLMADIYDSDKRYADIQQRTGMFGDALRGTTWFTTMMVVDEINLIPFFGQLAKGMQVIKAGSKIAKIGAKADVVGAVLPKALKTGGIKEAVARSSVYGAGFAGIESFALMPASEKARRNQEIKTLQQWQNFAIGTALGGAIGGGGYWIGSKLAKNKNNFKLNKDEVDATIDKNLANNVIETRNKINDANPRNESVENLDRPDIDGNDFGNAQIDRNTGRRSYEADGVTSNNPNAPIKLTTNSTTGKVTLTVNRENLEFAVRVLQQTLGEDAVNIKIAGKRAKTFTKEQLQDVDGVLQAFAVKRRPQVTATDLTVVEVNGQSIGFRNNSKTDETIAYIKNEEGKYIAQSVEDSRKLFVAAQTKDKQLKQKLLSQVGKTPTAPSKIKQDVEPQGPSETYDVENSHKTKTHDEVADDLTSEGYRNIETVDELSTLPNTVGVRNRVVKAANNGQTKVKTTVYDQNGNRQTVDKDISETAAVNKEFNEEVALLKELDEHLEPVVGCMISSTT